MSIWTDYIKKWAEHNNCSYKSAMSNKNVVMITNRKKYPVMVY